MVPALSAAVGQVWSVCAAGLQHVPDWGYHSVAGLSCRYHGLLGVLGRWRGVAEVRLIMVVVVEGAEGVHLAVECWPLPAQGRPCAEAQHTLVSECFTIGVAAKCCAPGMHLSSSTQHECSSCCHAWPGCVMQSILVGWTRMLLGL